jgi:hypothetical protein
VPVQKLLEEVFDYYAAFVCTHEEEVEEVRKSEVEAWKYILIWMV